jgi:hypothetical protein
MFYKGKKQSYPCNRPWRPIGLWDVEAATFSLDSRLTDGGEVVSLTRRPPLTLKKIPCTHFCSRLSWSQSHNTVARVRSTEKFNKPIGNLTRDLLACSIGPQPTTLPRAPTYVMVTKYKPVLHLVVTSQSHLSLWVLCLPGDYGVVLLSIPPPNTHKLKPLDRSIYEPLIKFVNSVWRMVK